MVRKDYNNIAKLNLYVLLFVEYDNGIYNISIAQASHHQQQHWWVK